jgi:hypothetical protein
MFDCALAPLNMFYPAPPSHLVLVDFLKLAQGKTLKKWAFKYISLTVAMPGGKWPRFISKAGA